MHGHEKIRRAPKSIVLPAALALFAAAAFASAAHAAGPTPAVPRLSRAQDPLVQNMDPSTKPGTDFFQYAVGGWLKRNPIPKSERGWGIANLVREEVYTQLRGICEGSAAANARKGSLEQKVGDYWATGMDSAKIEREGAEPMTPYLDEIATIQTREDLLRSIAHFQALGFGPLYSMYIGQDERNSSKYLVHVSQGGLGLPDRGYYFDTDSSSRRIRAEYGKHLAAMFALLGENQAQAKRSAAAVVRLETALARRSRTLEERRDPWANYNKMAVVQMGSNDAGIDWKKQFEAMEVPRVDSVVVGQPEFLGCLDSCIALTPLADWKTYLRWNVVNSLASHLSRRFDQQNFHFYGTVMNGTPAQRPRWKRVLDEEEDAIGDLMGQVWVKKYCSPATKARYTKLTANVIDVYRDRIKNEPWMAAATKKRALAKLDRVMRKVAYPDRWRDYSAMQLDRSSYAANQVATSHWFFQHETAKLGKPIDRTEWFMTPQTYNAYYDGSKVEIVLPAAAFMLPGVPDSLVDDAILYSYAGGSTIGHEITHGFDDEGRQSDEQGNLNPWWTVEDSVQFTKRAKKLADQFSQYVVSGKHVRGQATLGENIADLGGVVLGYEAFKKTDQWKKGEKLNGLTPDQRYFLGYALSWMGQRRPESLKQQIMTDVHAPQFLRVNGPLANIPAFYQAFGVKPGDRMYRPEDVRVEIW